VGRKQAKTGWEGGSVALGWGILGTGGIAATFADHLTATDSGDVVAVGSRTAESAGRFAERFGIGRSHGSYAELVADPAVDVVYVATPHPLHRDNALLALAAGKPVLVEKPFTMNAAEAREVVAAAAERGLFVMEAMWTRFLPHIVKLRELLAAGVLGELVTVHADHGQWFAQDRDFRLFAPELGGGALLDLGVYPVSFASMVLGEPATVLAHIDPAFTGVDGQTSMVFGYAGGAHAVLNCTLRAVGPTRAAVVGTEGRIEIDGAFYRPNSFTLIPRTGEPTRYPDTSGGRGLRFQADEVARCLAAGLTESPVLPLAETISIMSTMDQVLAAAHPAG
jgi:predicted dehydrogenase